MPDVSDQNEPDADPGALPERIDTHRDQLSTLLADIPEIASRQGGGARPVTPMSGADDDWDHGDYQPQKAPQNDSSTEKPSDTEDSTSDD